MMDVEKTFKRQGGTQWRESSRCVSMTEMEKQGGAFFRMNLGILGKFCRRLKAFYQIKLKNPNYVFERIGPFPPPEEDFCNFARYDRLEEVPAQVSRCILAREGESTLLWDRKEMMSDASMFVAFIGGDLASVLFARQGRYLRKWFLKMGEDDIVIFRVRTYPKFRGRGVAPMLMEYAMSSMLEDTGKAFIDCRMYNASSIKSIYKARFRMIAEMKPISRNDALRGRLDKR